MAGPYSIVLVQNAYDRASLISLAILESASGCNAPGVAA
jgi:hypothetical protein